MSGFIPIIRKFSKVIKRVVLNFYLRETDDDVVGKVLAFYLDWD